MPETFVPHSRITDGWYYLRTDYIPFYCIVHVIKLSLGPDAGKYGVWTTDKEGYDLLDVFDDDQFIRPVPPPPGMRRE